ncbi:Ribonuclease H-like superfamily protein [Rhynchospora pubera]|uniref:Ribonuclease H-like superfamily protein n=1 Tax=Rhynchospora pubera TaxID=906938 RepID=A0AAV8GFF9_9POAL|nr:Ribonuclease H-like superfamily protein [Rhynchospora pubera]
MAAQKDKLWVRVMTAKYLSRKGFWEVKNTSGVSTFWRQVLGVRDEIRNEVKWKVGDGTQIKVFINPWFSGWNQVEQPITMNRSLTVSDLLGGNCDQWDVGTLQQIFGQTWADHIMRTVVVYPGSKDTLIWLPSRSGKYETKEAYKRMIHIAPQETPIINSDFTLWTDIWKLQVPPRVITFLWRCLHDALPVMKRLNKIFKNTNPVCFRCGQKEETVKHVIFDCPSSRALWFASELNIITDRLPQELSHIVAYVMENFYEDEKKIFFSIMWQIWKGRCDFWFKGTKFEIDNILVRVKSTVYTNIREVLCDKGFKNQITHYELPAAAALLLVDGSWDMDKRMGLAVLIYDSHGNLYHAQSKSGIANDSFVAEAEASFSFLLQSDSIPLFSLPRAIKSRKQKREKKKKFDGHHPFRSRSLYQVLTFSSLSLSLSLSSEARNPSSFVEDKSRNPRFAEQKPGLLERTKDQLRLKLQIVSVPIRFCRV